MRTWKSLAAILAAALAACSSSSSGGGGGGPPYTGFVQPAGTVAVNFVVDDTANKVYGPGSLKWKGSMNCDPNTRVCIPDSNWNGRFPINTGTPLAGWATLTDDGPWTVTTTAHEPDGSTAGDHKWGVTIFVVPPVSGSQTYGYGIIDADYERAYGNGWFWPPPDGQFTVHAGDTGPINAGGLVIPAFGTNDIQLQIDTSQLDSHVTNVGTTVSVKGSAWAWGLVDISDSKSGTTYTFTYSDHIGAGKQFNHSGLLHSADKAEFIFTFDAYQIGTTTCCASGCDLTAPCEYKYPGNTAAAAGVTAGTRVGTSGAWNDANVSIGNNNTYITVP